MHKIKKQFCFVQSAGLSFIFCLQQFFKHFGSEIFGKNKIKLKFFFVNLFLKFHRNENHFVQKKQDTEHNKIVHAVFFFRKNAFVQIESFIIDGQIIIKNIHHFMKFLKIRFEKIDSVNTIKHEFYKLRQINKI